LIYLKILYAHIINNIILCSSAPDPQKDLLLNAHITATTTADPLLQLVSLQKASGCWDLDVTLADAFGKTEDELTNQKPAQVRDDE